VRTFQADDLAEVSALIHRTIDVSYAGVYPPRAIAHFHEHHAAIPGPTSSPFARSFDAP